MVLWWCLFRRISLGLQSGRYLRVIGVDWNIQLDSLGQALPKKQKPEEKVGEISEKRSLEVFWDLFPAFPQRIGGILGRKKKWSPNWASAVLQHLVENFKPSESANPQQVMGIIDDEGFKGQCPHWRVTCFDSLRAASDRIWQDPSALERAGSSIWLWNFKKWGTTVLGLFVLLPNLPENRPILTESYPGFLGSLVHRKRPGTTSSICRATWSFGPIWAMPSSTLWHRRWRAWRERVRLDLFLFFGPVFLPALVRLSFLTGFPFFMVWLPLSDSVFRPSFSVPLIIDWTSLLHSVVCFGPPYRTDWTSLVFEGKSGLQDAAAFQNKMDGYQFPNSGSAKAQEDLGSFCRRLVPPLAFCCRLLRLLIDLNCEDWSFVLIVQKLSSRGPFSSVKGWNLPLIARCLWEACIVVPAHVQAGRRRGCSANWEDSWL